jgi:hypothetical protein
MQGAGCRGREESRAGARGFWAVAGVGAAEEGGSRRDGARYVDVSFDRRDVARWVQSPLIDADGVGEFRGRRVAEHGKPAGVREGAR